MKESSLWKKGHSTKANILRRMIPMLAIVCVDADLSVGGLDAQGYLRAWRSVVLMRSGGRRCHTILDEWRD